MHAPHACMSADRSSYVVSVCAHTDSRPWRPDDDALQLPMRPLPTGSDCHLILLPHSTAPSVAMQAVALANGADGPTGMMGYLRADKLKGTTPDGDEEEEEQQQQQQQSRQGSEGEQMRGSEFVGIQIQVSFIMDTSTLFFLCS